MYGISGLRIIVQETWGLDFESDNAIIINEDDSEDYLVECLGEFTVVKQCEEKILDLFQNKSEYVVQEIKKTFEGEFF